MQITIRAKHLTVAGLLGLVFLAGYSTKAYQDAHRQAKFSGPVWTIPNGTTTDVWCGDHPSTNWADSMHNTGICTAQGYAHFLFPSPAK
jgi:hypothetical protein